MNIDYQRLAHLIKAKSGLTLDRTRIPDIETICDQLMSINDVRTPYDLMNVLESIPTSAPSWQQLLRRVTIGETYFFRNAAHFNALQATILPALIQHRRQQNMQYLNIWSAGCSTGEEAYSIAILLKELIHDIDAWTIRILATDINEQHIEIAREGIYRQNSFRRETRSHVQANYFTKVNNSYILHEDIKQLVRFANLNLITDTYPSFNTQTMHQDIIFCRNVTIYFDEITTRSIVDRFYQSLAVDGYLFVGHSEPSLTTYHAFETNNIHESVMYRKILSHVPASPFAEKISTVPQPIIAKAAAPKKVTVVAPVVDTLQVKAAINRNDPDNALSLLAILEQQDPMNPEIHYLRGLVLMHSGSLDEARQSLRRSLYCDPKFALSHYAMAEIYYQQSNLLQAKRCWLLSDRAVAGLDEDVTLADDLTVGMFRDLLNTRLNQSGQVLS